RHLLKNGEGPRPLLTDYGLGVGNWIHRNGKNFREWKSLSRQ
ncbi:MAG: hypothetical protein ACI84D_003373, partial [Thalassolituus oleivorans]